MAVGTSYRAIEVCMSEFRDDVVKAFKRILSSDGLLRVGSSRSDPMSFGNAVVYLSNSHLLIRLIRDRGEVFAETASNLFPNDWFPLQRAVNAVEVSSMIPEGVITLDQAATLVETHLAELSSGFSEERIEATRRKLAEIEQSALERYSGEHKV